MAHERGLGTGDVDQIEIVGMDRREFETLNFGFRVKKSPVIMWDQILRKKTPNIKWLHHLLFYSPVFKTFIRDLNYTSLPSSAARLRPRTHEQRAYYDE